MKYSDNNQVRWELHDESFEAVIDFLQNINRNVGIEAVHISATSLYVGLKGMQNYIKNIEQSKNVNGKEILIKKVEWLAKDGDSKMKNLLKTVFSKNIHIPDGDRVEKVTQEVFDKIKALHAILNPVPVKENASSPSLDFVADYHKSKHDDEKKDTSFSTKTSEQSTAPPSKSYQPKKQ